MSEDYRISERTSLTGLSESALIEKRKRVALATINAKAGTNWLFTGEIALDALNELLRLRAALREIAIAKDTAPASYCIEIAKNALKP